MRLLLLGLPALLLLLSCSQQTPTAPTASLATVVDAPSLLGEYDLTIDGDAVSASLTPVRTEAALGDEYHLDLGATLKPICADCFKLTRIGLTGGEEIALDFDLRHPFPTTFAKKQYDVFDVRAIVLVPLGGEGFNETPPGPNGVIATNAAVMPNAEGYTTHYTERYPGIFRATVHPFITFFTEDNPDPLIEGAEIPDHRMTYGQHDERRMLIVPPSSPFTFRLVLEASYVEAADGRDPASPGGSANPVFFLPEGHMDEPYRVDVEVVGNPVQVAVPETLTIRATVVDWQAGFFGDAGYPNLSNPSGLDQTQGLGGLGGVTCEIPVIFYYSDVPTSTIGLGTTASPRVWTFDVPFEVTSVGRFPLLIAVSDMRQPADLTGLGSLADLRAFRIAWIDVTP